jgi:hypothetical protein
MGRRKQGPEPTIVGQTTEGRPVIDGEWVFYMSDTRGVHLTDILVFLDEKGFSVGWPGYLELAKKQGWKEKTILTRLRDSITDVFGGAYFDGWMTSYENWKEKQKWTV